MAKSNVNYYIESLISNQVGNVCNIVYLNLIIGLILKADLKNTLVNTNFNERVSVAAWFFN